MGVLRGIERRIESLVEGVFGRAFRAHVQPVELARKLVKEMEDGKSVSVSRVYVPNEYRVYLSPRDREQFRAYEASLVTELAEYLAEHARREGYALLSAPRVVFLEDADLQVGEFGIATQLVQPPPSTGQAAVASPPPGRDVSETKVYRTPEPPAPIAQPASEPARTPVLLVGGVRHELTAPVTTVGRSKDCTIAVDDASVSRRHAELRVENGAVWVVDLGSTNGTEVNGRRADRTRLEHGDRIVVGQTEITFERP